MLEIRVNGMEASAKGEGSRDQLITDATFVLLASARVVADNEHVSVKEALSGLVTAAFTTLGEYGIEKTQEQSVVMPDLDNMRKSKDSE